MSPDSSEVTDLLHRWRDGDRVAEGRLFEVVLPELKRIARYCMSRERKDHTIQATELIGQVYSRLVRSRDQNWQDRGHFFAIAARAMRRYLIEYARARKPGVEVPVDDIEGMLPSESNIETAVMIDGLLFGLIAD